MRYLLCCATMILLLPDSARAQGDDKIRGEVIEFVQAYVEAINRTDVAAAMEMVCRKPGVTSIGIGEISRGWEAIRADADQIVGAEGSYRLSIGSIDVLPLGSTYAIAVTPMTLTVATQQGTVQLRGAMSLVVERGQGWRIVHEHSSITIPNQ